MQEKELFPRDNEFIAALNNLAPTLHKKFFTLICRSKVRDDRRSLTEDLVSLTTLEALQNSRKMIHNGVSCEQLLRTKAKNVWADYWKQRNTSFNHSNHIELQLEWKDDFHPSDTYYSSEKMEWLLNLADKKTKGILMQRLEGYEVNEIAKMQGKTPGAISMQIQRLKEKIKQRPY